MNDIISEEFKNAVIENCEQLQNLTRLGTDNMTITRGTIKADKINLSVSNYQLFTLFQNY